MVCLTSFQDPRATVGGAECMVPEDEQTRRGKESWNHKKEIKVDLHQKSVNLETQQLVSRMTLLPGT